MKKSIAICAVAIVVLVGIVPTSTASATILGTVNIQNHNNSLSDIGWGGGLVGANCYTGVYSWVNAGGDLVWCSPLNNKKVERMYAGPSSEVYPPQADKCEEVN
ncbi:MAG: hypothetical protein ABR913_05340 [Sedimentisphaerales bacterium]|jgi:hypothetical protein